MAIIERPSTTQEVVAPATPSSSLGALKRPVATTGWKSWLFTVDHKKLGIMYSAAALFFFIVGGLEAVLIRLQLAAPNGKVLNADLYNQMFTMHATTMVFLFVMPMAAGLANYFIPLQIGARDVAFPRINAFSFWAFLFGGLFLNMSWFLGGAADGGWFMYAPNSGPIYSPSHGIDFWILGLQITGIASLAGAVNLITTVLNMRAPGMKLMRMPIFTWMQLVVQFLLLFAVPVITVALFLLSFQRNFDATFFDVAAGADPLLWQHLFWIFGVHLDPSKFRCDLGSYSSVLAKAVVWLSVCGVLGCSDWFRGLGRVGTPHVCFWTRTSFSCSVLYCHHGDCRSNGRQGGQLDHDTVGWKT
jgi:cytochrome c oxidase subunit 1